MIDDRAHAFSLTDETKKRQQWCGFFFLLIFRKRQEEKSWGIGEERQRQRRRQTQLWQLFFGFFFLARGVGEPEKKSPRARDHDLKSEH